MRIILVGPPGCGKGTQAGHIVNYFDIEHVSTGNMIRQEIAENTELGKHAKNIIDKGHFLSDDIIMGIVHNKLVSLKSKGALFDGFPRTIPQAESFDEMGGVDIVFEIAVSDEEVIKRISQRFMVELNHSQYTFKNKAEAEKFVSIRGGKLFHRKDDTPKIIQERLSIYHTQTKPLVDYYGKQHKLYIINGEKSINLVWKDIRTILTAKGAKKKFPH